jgi:hypothetical protein
MALHHEGNVLGDLLLQEILVECLGLEQDLQLVVQRSISRANYLNLCEDDSISISIKS